MAIKHGSKVDAGFSAASMTDLMFLLLLFMLMATTLINPNALKLLLPKSASPNKDKALTTVSVTADLKYYVEMQPVSLDAMAGALHTALDGKENPMVSVHCDEVVQMKDLMPVMNVIKDNGYPIILATRPN